MGFKDWMAKTAKSLFRAGEVNGSQFPLGTFINFAVRDKANPETGAKETYECMLFTYPDGKEEEITHDMVKCATVLAMGVMDIDKRGNTTTLLHGTKYLCVLQDGRQAVLTVGIGATQYKVERILF